MYAICAQQKRGEPDLSMTCRLKRRRCSIAACSCTLCRFTSGPTVAERYSHSRHVPAEEYFGKTVAMLAKSWITQTFVYNEMEH